MKPKISIMFPTRKRTDALIKSVASLLHFAHDTANIEFLIVYDQDDEESREFFANEWEPFLAQTKATSKVFASVRHGYLRLHKYVNHLATEAEGDWICSWNDDCYMLTQDWDKHIIENDNFFGLLRMPCANMEHPFALMPVVPREWINVFGEVSVVNHIDWWIYQVCKFNNAVRDIPVQIYHDRADVTGNNNDSTYQERSYDHDGKNPNNPEDHSHPDRRRDLQNWIEKFHNHVTADQTA